MDTVELYSELKINKKQLHRETKRKVSTTEKYIQCDLIDIKFKDRQCLIMCTLKKDA